MKTCAGLVSALCAATVLAASASGRAQTQSEAGLQSISSFGLGSGTLHDPIHTLVTAFSGRPFNTTAEIDRLIGRGDPWHLLRETELKLVTLPPRLRLVIFGLIAERFASARLLGFDASIERDLPLNSPGWVLQLSGPQSNEILNPFVDTIVTHFTEVQLVDLITATAFHLPFLPHTMAGWHSLRRSIDRYDLWIVLGAALIGALANEGTFQIAGQFFTDRTGVGGLGWYVGTNKLGIKLDPIFRGGLNMLTDTTQIQVGLLGQVNAPLGSENSAVEAQIREHFFQNFGQPRGWEFIVIERGHYVISHTFATASHVLGSLETYARYANLFGDPDLNFQAGFAIATDFQDGMITTQTLGLDQESFASTVVVQVTENVDLHSGAVTYRAGLLAGGSLGSGRAHYEREQFALAAAVRDALAALGATRARVNELRLQQSADVPAVLDAQGEDRETPRLRRAYYVLVGQRLRLARLLRDYLDARAQYFSLIDPTTTLLTDDDGVLDADLLAAARREIASPAE